MSKILINDINTQFGFKAAINEKLAQIQDEFNDKVLYRDNPIGEPNVMSSDLDMGGNDILNINKITVNDIGVVGESSFQELIVEAQAAATTAGEQATLSSLYKDASALSASQSATSATESASHAADAQAAALLVDPRMDVVEAEVATQTTSINTFKADVSNLFGALIGSIQSIFCSDSYVPLGMVPANGAEYSRSQFPDLYDNFLVGGKLLTTDYTSFTTQIGLTGNCAKFALDTVNQKFKVPLLKDGDSITHAASAAELGKSVKAGLPNITGKQRASLGVGSGDTTGAFVLVASSGYTTSSGAGGTVFNTVDFDASKSNAIYGNSTTVTDEQVRLRHFVVLASAQNNASMFDWSNYMSALAGKMNNDLSNVDLTKANVVLQRVRYQTSANATTQVTMPWDNTVPQITEGTQFMSINFTPRKAGSRLVIDVLFNGTGYGGSGWHLIVAIFQDTIQDAIDSGVVYGNASYVTRNLPLSIEVPAGSVAPRTYSVRAGCSAGGMGFNGQSAGVSDLGGTIHSHITVTEYAV